MNKVQVLWSDGIAKHGGGSVMVCGCILAGTGSSLMLSFFFHISKQINYIYLHLIYLVVNNNNLGFCHFLIKFFLTLILEVCHATHSI